MLRITCLQMASHARWGEYLSLWIHMPNPMCAQKNPHYYSQVTEFLHAIESSSHWGKFWYSQASIASYSILEATYPW